jgi:hypothetical protein
MLASIIALLLCLGVLLYVKLRCVVPSSLRHLPGPRPVWFFGNTLELRSNTLATYERWHARYGNVLVYFYFREAVVLVSDASMVEEVFAARANIWSKERDRFVSDIVGNGLLVSQGEFWRKQRKLMVCFAGLLCTPLCVNHASRLRLARIS